MMQISQSCELGVFELNLATKKNSNCQKLKNKLSFTYLKRLFGINLVFNRTATFPEVRPTFGNTVGGGQRLVTSYHHVSTIKAK